MADPCDGGRRFAASGAHLASVACDVCDLMRGMRHAMEPMQLGDFQEVGKAFHERQQPDEVKEERGPLPHLQAIIGVTCRGKRAQYRHKADEDPRNQAGGMQVVDRVRALNDAAEEIYRKVIRRRWGRAGATRIWAGGGRARCIWSAVVRAGACLCARQWFVILSHSHHGHHGAGSPNVQVPASHRSSFLRERGPTSRQCLRQTGRSSAWPAVLLRERVTLTRR